MSLDPQFIPIESLDISTACLLHDVHTFKGITPAILHSREFRALFPTHIPADELSKKRAQRRHG